MEQPSRHVVELLISEARDLYRETRYHDALAAARRAVAGAGQLDDLALRVRATAEEADCLSMLGDEPAALARYSWIIGVAQDPVERAGLGDADLSRQLASAFNDWAECAGYLPEMPARKVLGVLDAGESYLRSIGRAQWRAGLLRRRAAIFEDMGRVDQALGLAEEALDLKRRYPGAPGYTLATYLWSLGHLLRRLDRPLEAEPYYQEVIDDTAASAHGRKEAFQGLARCASVRDDHPAAVRHARSAVRLAEGMGDDVMSPALSTLVEVSRQAGDLVAAKEAADRHLDIARRLSDLRLYFALRDAVDVALDLGDTAAAQAYLAEATPLAAAIDRQNDVTECSDELGECRKRLAGLEAGGPAATPD